MSPARRRGWGILGRETAREPLAKGEEKDNMGMCGRRKREGRGRRGVEAEVDIDESKLPRGDMATPGPHARRSLRCLLRGRQEMRVSHSRGRGLCRGCLNIGLKLRVGRAFVALRFRTLTRISG